MDKTEITLDEITLLPKHNSEEMSLDGEPDGAPIAEDGLSGIMEADEADEVGVISNGDADAEDLTEDAQKGFSLMRLLSAILAFTFCAASATVCITGAVGIAAEHIDADITNLLTGEVFFDYTYKSSTVKDDIPPAADSDTQNSNQTDTPPDTAPDEINALYPSQRADLSVSKEAAYELNNQTSLSPDIAGLLKVGNENMTCEQIYKKYGEDAPVILIVHTHGTESYSENEEDYSADDSFRTENTDENVVAVGEVMAKVFEKSGINVIHDTQMYDSESYKDSYSRSYAAVQAWLEKYPSITYVFDVHRDAIIREDMTKICPVGSYDGTDVAQVMLVVGTDEGGADHENWEKNLSFALEVQSNLIKNDTIARAVNLRSAAFNQGLSNGFLLLEVGSCGNTLEQAKRSSILTALAISDAISEKKSNLDPKKLFEELV